MPSLTEATIRSHASEQSFERGREYYRSGAIYNTIRQGNTLRADCVGSETYHLHVELDEGGIQSAACTCPYSFGGYCKHIVALLLTYIHKPDEFAERKSVPALLEDVDQAALVTILTKLIDRNPELYDWLETNLPIRLAAVQKAESQPKPAASQISEKAWRKRIKNIFRHSGNYYDDYQYAYGLSQEMDDITIAATDILAAGDAQGAITILLALLEELYDSYEYFDDSDAELADSADYAGEVLAEAILSAKLDAKERKSLGNQLDPIRSNLSDYGIEKGLELAHLALEYGWETQPFQSELDTAKLNVLERQGRTEEFLSLCQQTGQSLRYTQKLLQLGRMAEGIRAAYQIAEPNKILEIAKELREKDHLAEAVHLAEHGLTLEGAKYHLAAWLAPLEETLGKPEEALLAHLAAFAELPKLETYQSMQQLSGERWKELQPEQMKILLQSGHSEAIVDVYLYEQMWDEAIEVAEKNAYSYSLREKVADAIIAHRPNWVIRISIQEAEKLIEPTKSKYYPHAARWLAKAKEAYLVSGREAEWTTYLAKIKTLYARRPSLQKELANL
ncbi:MAG: SWIM zinc finger domain-containing protein [Chloroflexi bacterium]|jgi:uncharacterized Zn finger protein|nr:SWIM zinc finger domain-containing protein [Chloroflexota bacterium]